MSKTITTEPEVVPDELRQYYDALAGRFSDQIRSAYWAGDTVHKSEQDLARLVHTERLAQARKDHDNAVESAKRSEAYRVAQLCWVCGHDTRTFRALDGMCQHCRDVVLIRRARAHEDDIVGNGHSRADAVDAYLASKGL